MTLKDAKSYINYGIKEGYFEQETFESMTDEQLIDFAKQSEFYSDVQLEAALEAQMDKSIYDLNW